MENITNMQEEWKEARFRRMDEALTKIDEAVGDAKSSMPATVPKDTGTQQACCTGSGNWQTKA